jgi:F420-non-reducing hydrogenase iron-sulfur subunit
MKTDYRPRLTIFHCTKVFEEDNSFSYTNTESAKVDIVKLPCSSMVNDVFLLRAFEAGSDGVMLIICSDDDCQFVDGSIRARKRAVKVKKTLQELEIEPERLSIFNIAKNDHATIQTSIQKTLDYLATLNPIYSTA